MLSEIQNKLICFYMLHYMSESTG